MIENYNCLGYQANRFPFKKSNLPYYVEFMFKGYFLGPNNLLH